MLTVADIMTANVFTIRSSAKLTQAILLMQQQQVRSLIVEREVQGGAYGILTGEDIVYKATAKCADPSSTMVCELMSAPCLAVEPDLSLPALAQRFLAAGVRRAPVIEDGRLLGVVSITDIIMRSNVESIHLPCDLSEKIEVALRHSRLNWTEDSQLEQECEAARQVLSELS